jgi:alpha-tubulin suppressor-like RCC1 family protein
VLEKLIQILIWPHFGQSVVPANIGQCKKVSAGRYHSLAIDKNNKIHAWGAGQLVP